MKTILNTLYVQTQKSYLKLDHDTIKIDVAGKNSFQMPLHHLGGIVMFGNVLISPFFVHRCAEDGRSVVWLSQYGRFKARLSGPMTGNVLLRRAQHATLDQEPPVLEIARAVVAGKLQNSRRVLMRAARETTDSEDQEKLRAVSQIHVNSIKKLARTTTLDEIRGEEGICAKGYFEVFDRMIRTNRDFFSVRGRTRRPPLDPVNSLLSFFYSLLVGECVAACEGVGLDPQMGFLHALRPGRPSLALDLMEELRAPLADRLVLTLINRGQIKPKDFVKRPGGAVLLNDEARKTILVAYQKRKQDEVSHGILGASLPFGLVSHIQARLLARHLRGDLPSYQPFVQR